MRAFGFLSSLAGLLFVLLVSPRLYAPLIYDDANFALAAKAVADTGLPYGNQGWMSERGDFSQREQWALWHPPLYVYILGLFAKLGWVPAALRLPGFVSAMVSMWLTYLLARDLTRAPPEQQAVAGNVAATLFVLSPSVMQSSLIVDIDFALLLPLTLLFLWLYLKQVRPWRLALLFAVLLWAKMTNPLPLLAVVVVWQLLRGQYRTAAVHFATIGLGGIAVFAVSWIGIGSLLGFPLDMPFGVNIAQWQDSAEVARRAYASPGAFIEGLQPSVLWLGPGLVALGLAGVALRSAQLVRCWRFRQVDVLLGLTILLVLGYVNKNAGWFPKYQVALAPLLACLGAPLVAQGWCQRPKLTLTLSGGATLATAVVVLRLVRDDWALQRTYAIDATAAAWLLGAFAIAMAAAVAARAGGVGAVAALAGMALGWSVATGLVQANAPYATTYQYGTSGSTATAQWLDSHLAADETYIAAKELAIRIANQRYVDQDTLLYFLDTGRGFNGTWQQQPVRTIAAWQREPYVASLLDRSLPALGYQVVASFGDYTVYQRAQ